MADILEIVSKEAIQGILDAGKGIINLDENLLKLQKNIAGYKTQLDAVNNSNTSLNQKSGEYAKLVNKAADNNNKLVMSAKALEGQQKQLTQTEAKLGLVHSQTNVKLQEQKIKLNEANKALREKLKTGQAEEGSLVRMRQRLRELTEAYDNSGKRTKAAAKEIGTLSKEIEIAENETNRFQRGVGGYAHQMKGMVSGLATGSVSLKQFGRAAAGAGKAMMTMLLNPVGLVIAAVASLGLIIGKAVKQAREYQATNAELAGVMGKTRAETMALQRESQRLGATTAFTATEVAQLQIEYARLGFAESEIMDVTQATINLSIASKATAEETAAFVGSTIRGYGLTTEEAGRVADVAAKAFSSSALDFQKLKTGLATVAPAAAAFGDNIETTVSKLGKLADAGIDASTAGTSLRNIYLELSKRGMTYDEAMTKIATSQDKLTAANELFGKRGAVAAVVLSNEAEGVRELNAVLNEAGGTAENVANEQLNTLDGSFKLLGSAWSGLLFSFEDGEGIFIKIFKHIVDYITFAITGITKVINGISTVFAFLGKVISDVFSLLKPATDGLKSFGASIKENVMKVIEPVIKMLGKLREAIEKLPFVKKAKKYVTAFIDERKEKQAIQQSEKAAKKAVDANADFALQSQEELNKKQIAEAQKLAKAKEDAEKSAREREHERRLMTINETIESEKEKNEKIFEAEKQYINQSILLLQEKLNAQSLSEVERLAINEEINKEVFALDKLVHENKLKLKSDEIKATEEANKIIEKEEKELVKQQIRAAQIAYDQKLMLIRANSANEEEFAAAKFELDKEILGQAIEQNQLLLENSEITGAARLEIENAIAEQRMELDSIVWDKEQKQNEDRLKAIDKIGEASKSTAAEIFNFRAAMLDREMAKLEQQKEAGQITEEEYAKKKAEIEIKQAKTAKAQGIFNAIINTAQGVTAALKVAPPFGFILAGLVGAMGAMQIASIASQPLPSIPAFAEGTHGLFNTPSTFLAGEAGTEIVEKNGKSMLVDKPTIFTNLKGARVFSNPETEYIMNWKEHGGVQGSKYDAMLFNEMKGLRKDIKNMPQPIIQDGRKVGVKQNNHTKKILNRYKYGYS